MEEIDTLNWLCEAHSLGVINDFTYQPEPFNLFDSVKYEDVDCKQRTLFKEHSYTADFCVAFDANKNKDLAKEFKVQYDQLSANECSVYIDSKGTFNRNERAFGYNQKWLWQVFKTYIYKLVPQKFFKKFGVPEKSTLSAKQKKPRKMFLGLKLLKEVFQSNK